MEKNSKLLIVAKMSNIDKVIKKSKQYLGHDNIFISTKTNKKFMVEHPITKKLIHFGDTRYKDFTKHEDIDRRNSYLARANSIKGKWKDDMYSPNNLSINILW